jgi:hypothetical protein
VFDISANGAPTAWTISSQKGLLGNEDRFSTSKDIWYSKGIRNYFLNALHILNIIIFYILSLLPGSMTPVPFMVGVLKKRKRILGLL